jgi:hypothetical protein
MKKSLVAIACMAALAILLAVQSAAAQGKLEGIWKKTEVTVAGPNAQKIPHPQPNVCIFAKKYYSFTEVEGEKPRPDQPLEKATDAQKVAAWEPFSAEAGTYEVKGTTITFHVVVEKDPEGMKPGSFYTGDFKIEGNTLIITLKADNTGPIADQIAMKFVRVE